MDFTFTDKDGTQKPLYVASYGIGVTRVMGVIAEMMSDEKGLIWHTNIAPFHVYLATIGKVENEAETLYKTLTENDIEVLYDDRDERPGAKFADAELMGIPYRIVLSERTLENGSVEFFERETAEITMVPLEELVAYIKDKVA
jgi:prolyl-tRNA synthetase